MYYFYLWTISKVHLFMNLKIIDLKNQNMPSFVTVGVYNKYKSFYKSVKFLNAAKDVGIVPVNRFEDKTLDKIGWFRYRFMNK